MNPKKNTVAVTFRCDVAVADQLDELCRMMGIKHFNPRSPYGERQQDCTKFYLGFCLSSTIL